jgi:cysteinyl-tRNA synthetase
VHFLREAFDEGLNTDRGAELINILLDLDRMIWESRKELSDETRIAKARETFRGMIAQLGVRFEESPRDLISALSPLVDIFLEIRGELRRVKQWELADEIRRRLSQRGIVIEDTSAGPRWHLQK